MKIKPKIKPKLKVKNIDEKIKKIYIDHHERKQGRRRRMRDLFLYFILLVSIFGCTKPIPEVVYLTKYDTIYVSKLDTTYINRLDTTYIHTTDTLYIVLTDTIYVVPPIITPDSDIVFDVEGHSYSIVKIGTQSWLASNLYTAKYNTGEDIPTTIENTWNVLNPSYVYIHNATKDISKDGLLYTWSVVDDTRGICPTGYRVSSVEDWEILDRYFKDLGYNTAKIVASSEGWDYSYIPTTIGYEQETNNASGFNAIPLGHAGPLSWGFSYTLPGRQAEFWTSVEAGDDLDLRAMMINFQYDQAWIVIDHYPKSWAYPIRCIKN